MIKWEFKMLIILIIKRKKIGNQPKVSKEGIYGKLNNFFKYRYCERNDDLLLNKNFFR